MNTAFLQLNSDWNAEPNAPEPKASWAGSDLKLTFLLNPFQFPQFSSDDIGEITFSDCARYRFGTINDEGWYRGQCRFSKIAPAWGEFYEVTGDIKEELIDNDWIRRSASSERLNHYLFYFRDEEFECDARSWTFRIIKAEQGAAANP